MKLQECFTGYEKGDSICDGDPNGPTEGDRAPCVARDRCAALKRHIAETGADISDFGKVVQVVSIEGQPARYFRAADWDGLVKQLDGLVKEYGPATEHGGEPAAEEAEEHRAASEEAAAGDDKPRSRKGRMPDGRHRLKPGRKARAMARRTLMKAARERHKALLEVFRKFRASLAEQLPEYNWAGDHDAVAPGRLYVKDRLDSSGYASVYCKTLEGRDIPLASCRFKPRDLQMEVSFPFDPAQAPAGLAKKLELKPLTDGRFKSRTKKLDSIGLGLAVELIAKAVRDAKIDLPPARRPYGWKP